MAATSPDPSQKDRELFDSISMAYTRKDLHLPSRIARMQRLRSTLDVVPRVHLPEAPRVAEIGCGAGFAAEYLEEFYSTYLGLDHSARLVHLARSRHRDLPRASFLVADVLTWEAAQPFDLIFAIGVLHHLTDIRRALAQTFRALRPGGWIVVNEPQPGNPLIRAARWMRKRTDSSYSADQVELRGDTIHQLLNAAGFVDTRAVAQGFIATPLAEVIVPLGPLGPVVSRGACASDRLLERTVGRAFPKLSWNVAVAGRRPS